MRLLPLESTRVRSRLGASALLLGVINTIALIVVTSVHAAASESALDRVLRTRSLRVGCPLDYAPFALSCCCDASGGWQAIGSDVDAAQSLAASFGEPAVSVVLVPIPWSELAKRADEFDLGVGGISPTLARRQRVGFSADYQHGGKVVVAPCGSEPLATLRRTRSLASLDMPSTRALVNPGGTNEMLLREHLPRAQISLVAENGDQFARIAAQPSDDLVTLTDDAEAMLQTRRHAPLLCMSEPLLPETKAYMLPRGDVAWAAYVDDWLARRLASGAENASTSHWLAVQAADEGFCATGVSIGAPM
jgi:cyclohexadienyl dehydratase